MTKPCEIDECDGSAIGRGWCGKHYRRWRLYGNPDTVHRHYSTTGRCEVPDCERKPSGRHCKMHASRLARRGTFDPAPRTGRHTNAAGYELIKTSGHPVAQKNGWAYEHRVVLFDAIGDGPHPCHWCGKMLRWDARHRRDADYLIVDHLDNDPANNERANLAPACNRCNTVGSYVIKRERVIRLGDLLAVVLDEGERKSA